MSDVPAALKFDSHHATWRPFHGDAPGQARRLELGGRTPFGAGFTRIDRSCELQIQASSDQLLYVVSGELRVAPRSSPEDSPFPALEVHAGDVVQIRAGARVSLSIGGHCHFFYVLSPDIDWRTQLQSHA